MSYDLHEMCNYSYNTLEINVDFLQLARHCTYLYHSASSSFICFGTDILLFELYQRSTNKNELEGAGLL